MKKLLGLLSSSLIGTSSIANTNLATKIKTQQNKVKTLNDSETELNKLNNWHNGLSLAQDKIAKQDYLNAMNITTTKAEGNSLATYNITFDNSKLKTMLSNKIINQDVYSIWSNSDSAARLTNEANATVKINESKTNSYDSQKTVRAFADYFYIKDNKMYFTKQNNNNLDNKINRDTSTLEMISSIYEWYFDGYISFQEANGFITQLTTYITDGVASEVIDEWFSNLVMQLIIDEVLPGLEVLLALVGEGFSYSTNTHSSKYIFLNEIESNFDKVKAENNKYHAGVSETFYLWGIWLDPASIKAVPPLNKFSTFKDKDSAGFINKGKTIVNNYNFDTLISYSKYGSLWEFLNSNASFDLGKKFESSVGMLSKYKNYNTTFDKNQSSNILKPYLNNWVNLTSVSWQNSNWEVSSAKLDMEISDNPWNKTIYFNFKSTLCNDNTFDAVDNWMY